MCWMARKCSQSVIVFIVAHADAARGIFVCNLTTLSIDETGKRRYVFRGCTSSPEWCVHIDVEAVQQADDQRKAKTHNRDGDDEQHTRQQIHNIVDNQEPQTEMVDRQTVFGAIFCDPSVAHKKPCDAKKLQGVLESEPCEDTLVSEWSIEKDREAHEQQHASSVHQCPQLARAPAPS